MARAHPSHTTIEKITTSSTMNTMVQPDLQCCKDEPGIATHHRKPSINWHAWTEPIRFINQLHHARFSKDKTRTTTMSDSTVERRAVRRHKVLKGATLSFDDSGVACVVRNLSTSGATLELASSISLPTSFTLEIKADQFIRRCRRVWSRDKHIGVAFS